MSYNRTRITKKLLAIALCAMLILTLMPTTALAAGETADLDLA